MNPYAKAFVPGQSSPIQQQQQQNPPQYQQQAYPQYQQHQQPFQQQQSFQPQQQPQYNHNPYNNQAQYNNNNQPQYNNNKQNNQYNKPNQQQQQQQHQQQQQQAPVQQQQPKPKQPQQQKAQAKASSVKVVMPAPKKGAAIVITKGSSKAAAPKKADAAATAAAATSSPKAPEAIKVEAPKTPEPKADTPKIVEAPKAVETPKAVEAEKADISISEKSEIESEEYTKEEQEEAAKLLAAEDEESDKRDHMNIIFIGHVDAGKSTIAGNILYQTGMIDKRTIEKYEREAKEKNRGTWFLAYIMDTSEEERVKGITVEVGRATFETEKKRYTILDAPGHKAYVPNMIGGAAQADVGILVVSSRLGEFEAGFERAGQTREHAMLAKTIGIKNLIVAINKMDDRQWSKEVYDDISSKIGTFLKKDCQYSSKDVFFLPVSGYTGANLIEPLSPELAPWWNGPSLIQYLDAVKPIERSETAALRIPVTERYKEMGLLNIMGRVEGGTVTKGQSIILMPTKITVKVSQLLVDDKPVKSAGPGENVRIGIATGLEESDIIQGNVVCDPSMTLVPVVTEFVAQLAIVELLSATSLFTAGYEAVMHIHTCVRDVTVVKLLSEFDKKTKKNTKRAPTFVKAGAVVTARLSATPPVCMELFEAFQQLGRFTLRDKGKTIAIGKVLQIPDVAK